MKIKKRFSLTYEVPTSSQSDIAFLLIIFFIVTAIFFEQTGIVFKLPKASAKTLSLAPGQFMKIEAHNEHLVLNGLKTGYAECGHALEEHTKKGAGQVAIVYFSDDLTYGNYIRVFDALKKNGGFKVSVKPLAKK